MMNDDRNVEHLVQFFRHRIASFQAASTYDDVAFPVNTKEGASELKEIARRIALARSDDSDLLHGFFLESGHGANVALRIIFN